MRNSIFDIENRIDIEKEFRRFIDVFNESNTVYYEIGFKSYFQFLNRDVFNKWEYRDTFTDLKDYLEFIGIDDNVLMGYQKIGEITFLNFLELIYNLQMLIENDNELSGVDYHSNKVENITKHNVPIILEKLNYKIEKNDDRYIIAKRDSDVDSVLDIVPDNISKVLLEYNDIKNNNIESKRKILKIIDLYIENRKEYYKSVNKDTYNSIQTIVNKMGVNHPISKEPYKSLEKEELISWYDKCFKLMIHLIRTEEVIKVNKKRNELEKEKFES